MKERRFSCINRNIVECKLKMKREKLYMTHRINRNIVECKCAVQLSNVQTAGVLIETLWNVNYGTCYVLDAVPGY